MDIRDTTDAQFREAATKSISIAGMLRYLGHRETSTTKYRVAKRKIKKLSIDVTHHLGQAHGQGRIVPLEDYLSNKRNIISSTLRTKLLKTGLFQHRCCSCGLSWWKSSPVPLELHHIDGNHMNNNLKNLTLLCPNCHALTPTYKGKNKKEKRKVVKCIDCGSVCTAQAIRCHKCASERSSQKKSGKPSMAQLLMDRDELITFAAIAKKYKVCWNTIKKWFILYELSTLPWRR